MKVTDVLEHYLIDCENWGRAEGTRKVYRRYVGCVAFDNETLSHS